LTSTGSTITARIELNTSLADYRIDANASALTLAATAGTSVGLGSAQEPSPSPTRSWQKYGPGD
jgi:hypothetical protein